MLHDVILPPTSAAVEAAEEPFEGDTIYTRRMMTSAWFCSPSCVTERKLNKNVKKGWMCEVWRTEPKVAELEMKTTHVVPAVCLRLWVSLRCVCVWPWMSVGLGVIYRRGDPDCCPEHQTYHSIHLILIIFVETGQLISFTSDLRLWQWC